MASPFPKSSSSPGRGHIVAKLLPHGVCALESMTYQYPLKLISPHPASHQPSVLAFLLSYGGGLVGGDQVDLSITVREQARLSIVTQGHTKVFNSVKPDIVTRQSLDVDVCKAAALCLLPDPVQPFESSVYEQTQIFRLKDDASLVLLDWVTQGRLARGEDWSLTRWSGRNEVWLAPDDHRPATASLAAAQTSASGEKRNIAPSSGRLLVRDSIILDGVPGPAQRQPLKNQLQGHAVIGTLILRGPHTTALGEFFLKEFDSLPRLGSRDFDGKKNKASPDLEMWRAGRLQEEKRSGVLWSAANVRGCIVVKFGAASVEAGRHWIGAMLSYEGSVEKVFGDQALMCVR